MSTHHFTWPVSGVRTVCRDHFLDAKECLPFDSHKGRLVLELDVSFHTFCTELVMLNQIKTVFDLEYKRYVISEGYDRIVLNYLHAEHVESGDNASI